MKIQAKTVIIAVLAVAVLGLVGGPMVLGAKPSERAGAAGAPNGPPGAEGTAAKVYSVKTQTLKTGRLRDYIDLTGDVVTETNVDIYPDTGGKLTTILVQVGDSVVKGKTIIANVDPSKPGSTYALSPVYSPITGTVTSVSAQLGATVSTQTSLGTVGILSDLFVDSKVPETQVASLKPGLTAEIRFEAFPGTVFPAVVERVSPVVDTVSRTKTIRLRFTGANADVSLGMFAQVKLYFPSRAEKVLIPQESVVTRAGQTYAFVVENDRAVRRELVSGLLVDGILEVESGLKAGEVLVVKGQELLDDGSPVKVVNP